MTGEYHAHSHTHLHLHSQQQPEAGFQLPREFVFKKQKHKDRIKLSRNLNFISFEKCIVEIWDLFRDLNELFVFSFSNLSKFLFPSRFHVPLILYLTPPMILIWFDWKLIVKIGSTGCWKSTQWWRAHIQRMFHHIRDRICWSRGSPILMCYFECRMPINFRSIS